MADDDGIQREQLIADDQADDQVREQADIPIAAAGIGAQSVDRGANDMALNALALPNASATDFVRMDDEPGEDPVQSIARTTEHPENLEAIIRESNQAQMYIDMVNEGNVIDIAAQLSISEGLDGWRSAASAVLAIQNDPIFHITRCQIFSPLTGAERADKQPLIQQAKSSILRLQGVPSGVTAGDLSWDAISFKTPPNAVEFFVQRNPVAMQQLSAEQLAIIDEVEMLCQQAIEEKCAEFRTRTNTVADEFITDSTLYLETQIGGADDSTRELRIRRMGYGMLVQYVNRMQAVFATGNLPSSIQPAKIYACHDIATAAELRGSILKMCESQVLRNSLANKNKDVMRHAYTMAGHMAPDWERSQQTAILLKKNVDTFQRRVFNTFGENYEQPMARLENQLAGSSNTIKQQIEAHTSDAVVQLNEEQQEICAAQLSLLLACLRMRCNAVQQSDWELVTDDDLDHMEIVKFLVHQSEVVNTAQDEIYQMVVRLQQSYMNGHNTIKFRGKQIPQELGQLITYTMEGRAKIALRQIPLIDQDLKESGEVFAILMRCIIMSLAQKQRIKMELAERTVRRSAAASAQVRM